MRILDGGYFAGEVADLERPICFRYHGYKPLDVSLTGKEVSHGMFYLGEITMQPLAEHEKVVLKGNARVNGLPTAKLKAFLHIADGPINNRSNGTEPRPAQDFARSIQIKINSEGGFVAKGLSPVNYMLIIDGKGVQNAYQSINLQTASNNEFDVGTIVLEPQKSIALKYFIAYPGPSQWSRLFRDVIRTGEKWRSKGDQWKEAEQRASKGYGDTLEFRQKGERIVVDASYGPAGIADLGPGKAEDFSGYQIEATKLALANINKFEIKDGHVYLMDHKHFGYWVLFSVKFLFGPKKIEQ